MEGIASIKLPLLTGGNGGGFITSILEMDF
jgi:hypothetical protein